MAGNRSRNKEIIHCCVEREVYDMLTAHCDRTGQTKTTAVKRAIKAYCQGGSGTYQKPGQKPV